MYSTYAGAKRCAKLLCAELIDCGCATSLSECQQAVAQAGGYQDWHDLSGRLADGASRPTEPVQFGDRLGEILPPALGLVAQMWVHRRLTRRPGYGTHRNFLSLDQCLDWVEENSRTVMAINAMHRRLTPLFRPGSGAGQRLRLNIMSELCFGQQYPTVDHAMLTLTYHGTFSELFGSYVDHPCFEREFNRLVDERLIEWWPLFPGSTGTLVLHPPDKDAVRGHIELCRRLYEGYLAGGKGDAMFYPEGEASISSS